MLYKISCRKVDGVYMAEVFDSSRNQPTVCPHCSSTDLVLTNGTYNSGCGCLGLLLFGWWGLLLGLLGLGKYEMVCKNCGCRWPVGQPHRANHGGCGSGCLIVIIVFISIFIIAGCTSSSGSLTGSWVLENSPTQEPITLTIEESGKFYGFSGVNRYFGSLQQPLQNGQFIIKGTPGVTMMAGPDLQYEQQYLSLLASAEQWQITSRGNLILLNKGRKVAEFVLQKQQ